MREYQNNTKKLGLEKKEETHGSGKGGLKEGATMCHVLQNMDPLKVKKIPTSKGRAPTDTHCSPLCRLPYPPLLQLNPSHVCETTFTTGSPQIWSRFQDMTILHRRNVWCFSGYVSQCVDRFLIIYLSVLISERYNC